MIHIRCGIQQEYPVRIHRDREEFWLDDEEVVAPNHGYNLDID